MTLNICQLVTLCSGATAFVLNALLIPIIIFKSSERIGSYKYFLLAYTLNASLFALSQATALPTWYIPPNGYIFQSTLTILPRPIQQVQVMCFVLSYTSNTIIVTWCFLYRLAVIENPKPWLVRPKYLPFVLIGSFLLLSYMVASCWPIMPSDYIDELFRKTIVEATGVALSDVGYIGGEITINGKLNIGMAICLGSYCTLTFSASCVVLYCWNKIGAKLRELRSIASLQYRFQYRLYILLSLQTIMPIIFNIIPAFIVFSLSLAKVPVGDVILICGMVVSFAQIADPVFTVLLVADYKETIITWKNRYLKGQVAPTVSLYASSIATPSVVTVMPIIFNIFPAFVVFSLSLAKIPVGDVILVCGMVVSFAQIADPIFTVLLVTDYKEALITWKNRYIHGQVAPVDPFASSIGVTSTAC